MNLNDYQNVILNILKAERALILGTCGSLIAAPPCRSVVLNSFKYMEEAEGYVSVTST